jgi:hypothetical protein
MALCTRTSLSARLAPSPRVGAVKPVVSRTVVTRSTPVSDCGGSAGCRLRQAGQSPSISARRFPRLSAVCVQRPWQPAGATARRSAIAAHVGRLRAQCRLHNPQQGVTRGVGGQMVIAVLLCCAAGQGRRGDRHQGG